MAIAFSEIEQARERIAPYIVRTPFLPFPYASRQLGKDIRMKCEMLQATGSFKVRGAANCILMNLEQAKKTGVIAASAGNHAQGVASICQRLGIAATIVMPKITPPIKVSNTRALGAEVLLEGLVYDEAFEFATRLAQEQGLLFIHPFRDPLVMAGQGTVGLELLDAPEFADVEAVVVPFGGGGLITGVASALKHKRPKIKVYGVTARNASASWKSFKEGQCCEEAVKFTLAEGVATKRTDEQMLAHVRELVDDVYRISEEGIAHAIATLAEHGKLLSEGAGALPLAALEEGLVREKRVALVLSGGNIDLPALSGVVQRGLVAQERLVRLEITLWDRPGALHSATGVFAAQEANILQISHHRETLLTSIGETKVEFLLETRGKEHTLRIIHALKEAGIQVQRNT